MDRTAKVKLAKKVIATFQTKGMYPRWRVSDKMSDPYRASQAGLPLSTPMPAPLVYVQAHAHTLLTPYESEQVLVKMKEALNAAGFQCMLISRYGHQPSLNVLVDDASKVSNWKPNPRTKAVRRPTKRPATKPAAKRNPPSWDQGAYEGGLAKSRQIGIDNAETAIDQRKTYPSVRAAYAAFIVNAIDTVTERRLPGREAAVQAFLDHVAKPRKRRK